MRRSDDLPSTYCVASINTPLTHSAYSLPCSRKLSLLPTTIRYNLPIPFNTVNQFTLLDTYFTAKFDTWNFSFGKQSLWWGPEDEGALILTDNAAPMYMFRASPEQSFEIPLLSRILGPFKTDFFVGKLFVVTNSQQDL